MLADLGFLGAAERQAKLRLVYAPNQVLEARKISQANRTPDGPLTALDQDVEIVIRREPCGAPKPRRDPVEPLLGEL